MSEAPSAIGAVAGDTTMSYQQPMAALQSQHQTTSQVNQSPHKAQGRIINENEQKLRVAVQENEALSQLCEKKQIEQEKVNFRCQKAQSEFLEVMRELSRFRGEFLDNYSLRSKLMKIL